MRCYLGPKKILNEDPKVPSFSNWILNRKKHWRNDWAKARKLVRSLHELREVCKLESWQNLLKSEHVKMYILVPEKSPYLSQVTSSLREASGGLRDLWHRLQIYTKTLDPSSIIHPSSSASLRLGCRWKPKYFSPKQQKSGLWYLLELYVSSWLGGLKSTGYRYASEQPSSVVPAK